MEDKLPFTLNVIEDGCADYLKKRIRLHSTKKIAIQRKEPINLFDIIKDFQAGARFGAIQFGRWLESNRWRPIPIDNGWTDGTSVYSTEQLYEIFLKGNK